ncbi:hypothetical protein KBD20_02625 [Candidatus Saccharibacteria bacterium]|nr:hypothetical protein [Candidatus Saccharibacteria bacterium]
MNQRVSMLRYKVAKLFHNHEAFVIATVVLMLLMGVIIRINSLSNLPVDEAYYKQKTAQLKSVTFDQDAIKKIEELRDSNVTAPGAELPANRNNPFTE